MKLSDFERQSLARIESLLKIEDPAFAARMEWPRNRAGAASSAWPGRRPHRWLRTVVLVVIAVLMPLAITLLVAGSAALGTWAVVVGSVVVVADAAAGFWCWLSHRRSRDWVEGQW